MGQPGGEGITFFRADTATAFAEYQLLARARKLKVCIIKRPPVGNTRRGAVGCDLMPPRVPTDMGRPRPPGAAASVAAGGLE